jgi:hypothetical protein
MVRVDPTTKTGSRLGSIGAGIVWGLADWDGALLGITPDGQWLGINPSTAAREGAGGTRKTL